MGGRLLFGALSMSLIMLGAAAAQRADLPAGPNRDMVSRACQACHDLSMVIAATSLSTKSAVGASGRARSGARTC